MSSTVATSSVHAPGVTEAVRAEGLPLAPGTAGERERLGALLAEARELGLASARVQGVAARARPHAADVLHAGVSLVALVAAVAGSEAAMIGLLGLAGVAAARTRGYAPLAWPCPRSPCWNLVLRRPSARTRRVLVAVADRARPAPWLAWSLAAADVGAVGSVFWGASGASLAACGLAALGALAWLLGRPGSSSPESPEAASARSLLQQAARLERAGDEEVAVLLSGCGAEAGEGIASFCDWWALDRARVEIVGVGLPDAAARALARGGWTVRREA